MFLDSTQLVDETYNQAVLFTVWWSYTFTAFSKVKGTAVEL